MASLSQAIVKRCDDCGLRPAFTDRFCAHCYHEHQEGRPCLDCGEPSVGLGRCISCQQILEAKTWDAKRYPEREIGVVLDMDETFARPMGV